VFKIEESIKFKSYEVYVFLSLEWDRHVKCMLRGKERISEKYELEKVWKTKTASNKPLRSHVYFFLFYFLNFTNWRHRSGAAGTQSKLYFGLLLSGWEIEFCGGSTTITICSNSATTALRKVWHWNMDVLCRVMGSATAPHLDKTRK